MLVEFVMTLGFALLLSAIDVYFRDVEYMTGVFLMAWVWLTPIMYTYNEQSGILQKIISYNIMTPIITSYQSVLYYHTVPDLRQLAISGVISVIVLLIGAVVFKKSEGHFAELL